MIKQEGEYKSTTSLWLINNPRISTVIPHVSMPTFYQTKFTFHQKPILWLQIQTRLHLARQFLICNFILLYISKKFCNIGSFGGN
jgi:hypothetical protein